MAAERIWTRNRHTWRLANRTISLGERTLIMGIVNITPDSFSDGGQFLTPKLAIEHSLSLLDDGADILDLGAESTRPRSQAGSSEALSAAQEQARLMPVLREIRKLRPKALISVDTYKASTARTALDAGADIINDVSGLTWDPEMAATCAQAGCGLVLMHSRGKPQQWATQPPLNPQDLIRTVHEGLGQGLAHATAAGIQSDSIVLDPGYGFGKRLDANYSLLARQAELSALQRPLMAGLSRKSFLTSNIRETATPDRNPTPIEMASNAAMVAAILGGASIVRVHSVKSAFESAAIADAILCAV